MTSALQEINEAASAQRLDLSKGFQRINLSKLLLLHHSSLHVVANDRLLLLKVDMIFRLFLQSGQCSADIQDTVGTCLAWPVDKGMHRSLGDRFVSTR